MKQRKTGKLLVLVQNTPKVRGEHGETGAMKNKHTGQANIRIVQ